MKKIVACAQLFLFAFVFGCGGMNTCPPPLTYSHPLEKPFGHVLAIGRFVDKSFARYPLFLTGHDVQELLLDDFERNNVFHTVFTVPIERKDDPETIDDKALAGKANLIMEGEISESMCRFVGSNGWGVPMYLLIGSFFGFPLGFNIKAQTWQGGAELYYRVRDIKTDKVLVSRRVQAIAYRNFSIWEERTERGVNKNYVRRMITTLIEQNLKAALTKHICDKFKE